MEQQIQDSISYSIIVVCLNAGDKLLETIQSIASQTYQNYEIVLKDGGSEDGSVKAVEKWAKTAFTQQDKLRVVIQKDSGIYDAMNQAVAYAKGSFFLFLNAGDSFYDEAVLDKITQGILNKEQELGALPDIVYGNLYHKALQTVIYASPQINEFACYRNVPCHQTCFYHRHLFEKRGYEPGYQVRADYEHFLWCYFAAKAGIYYIPELVAAYEGGGFSETAENRKRSAREHKEITTRYMGTGKVLWYRTLLFLTLAPLRSKIAESEQLSKGYNKVKTWIYRRKG